MAKRVKDRARDSFREASREDILKYLDWARSTILDYNQSMRRMATFLILLVAAFELVANSRNVQITIASFQVARGSVVLLLLPALVAFLVVQMAADAGKQDRLIEVYGEVFKLWSEKGQANDLDSEVLNDPPLYWAPTSSGFRKENTTQLIYMTEYCRQFCSYVTLIGILAFEGHAYYVLFPAHASDLILWLISVFFTQICLTLAYFMLLAGFSRRSTSVQR